MSEQDIAGLILSPLSQTCVMKAPGQGTGLWFQMTHPSPRAPRSCPVHAP